MEGNQGMELQKHDHVAVINSYLPMLHLWYIEANNTLKSSIHRKDCLTDQQNCLLIVLK